MDSKNLKKDEILSESQYYKVVEIQKDEVVLETDNGEKIAVPKGYCDMFLNSADQFTETKKVTRTQLAEIVLKHPRVAMTINYQKQVKPEDVEAEIMAAYSNSTPTEFSKKIKKAVKNGLNGEERTIRGRHFGTTDDFGRLHFIDMEIAKGTNPAFDTRQRLVDPRTMNWAIALNVKYEVK